jgi:hypothetical protein
MPRLLRPPKPTDAFDSAEIDDARFILNARLGKVNATGKFNLVYFESTSVVQ